MAEDKNIEYEADDFISLEFDDGSKLECEIMGVFDLGKKEYIALIPLDDSDDVYIYEYIEYDDDTFELADIEDEATFKKVAEEFEAIMAEDDDNDEPAQ